MFQVPLNLMVKSTESLESKAATGDGLRVTLTASPDTVLTTAANGTASSCESWLHASWQVDGYYVPIRGSCTSEVMCWCMLVGGKFRCAILAECVAASECTWKEQL